MDMDNHNQQSPKKVVILEDVSFPFLVSPHYDIVNCLNFDIPASIEGFSTKHDKKLKI